MSISHFFNFQVVSSTLCVLIFLLGIPLSYCHSCLLSFFCFLCYLCIPQTLISIKIFNLSSEIYSPLSLGQYLLSENRFVKIQFPLCKLSFCDCADINIFMKVTVLDIIVLSTIIKTISKLVAQFEVFLPVYSMFAFEKSINIFFFNKHFLSLHLCWLTYIHSLFSSVFLHCNLQSKSRNVCWYFLSNSLT